MFNYQHKIFYVLSLVFFLFFISCQTKKGNNTSEKKEVVTEKNISGTTTSVNEALPLDPHQEDIMRIMEKMNAGFKSFSSSSNFDMDFAKLMSIHHQASIELANLQRRLSKDEKLKERIDKMEDQQVKEMSELIGIMKDIRLKSSSEEKDTSSVTKQWCDSLLSAMHSMSDSLDLVDLSTDIDKNYASLMIPHYHGSTLMAQYAVKKTKHPKIKKIAQLMIAVQKDEVRDLKSWISKKDKQLAKAEK